MRFIKKIVVVFGPPFSGKDTVGKRLAADFNLEHVSTSGLLEAHVPKFRTLTQGGKLAPDQMMIELFKKHLKSSELVLNTPRSATQLSWVADKLDPTVEALAIKLDLKKKEIEARRNKVAQTSRGPRMDDAALEERLREYNLYAAEVMPILRRSYRFLQVDGARSEEEVYTDCRAFCASRFR